MFDTPAFLAFSSAAIAGAMAIGVAFSGRRLLAHRLFAAGMAVLAVESVFSGSAANALLPDQIVYWQKWGFSALALLPGIWLAFSLTYARGNPRETLTRWRLMVWTAFLAPVGLVVLFWNTLLVAIDQSNSGYHWAFGLGLPGMVLTLLFLLSAVLVLMNLERTFRASVGTMRWRIKFMVLGLGVLFAVRAYTSSEVLVFRLVNPSLQPVNSVALLVACLLISRTLLRAGHFEVSVYPSQSVLHSSFTLLLAGIYLVIVGALAKLIGVLDGGATFHVQAFLVLVALVLLAILLLSDRVRLLTKRLVSRHFQRPFYDYRTVWRTFTESTARRVEQGELCDAVVKLVSNVFQTLSVTLWLVDDKAERLAFIASTSLSQAKAGHLILDAADAAEVISALSRHPDPVDLDASKEVWAAALRRSNPDQFPHGGNRLCVPLIAGGDLLGLMALGDRVGGVPFSLQDIDLLKAVSDQAAASLLNIRLSQRLSQAKQLEAFQAMSAFFVHDLKNTASTLSLMLQNLPIHFDDPSFRQDALRGISKTVTHLNELISRLNLIRQELTICLVECDLNELVTESLKGLDQVPGVDVHKELRPVPKLRVDPLQIQKVLTNLVLNAREAMGSGGRIQVGTTQRDGWAVLEVVDNGCGMSSEFLQESLFRPFRTTKKSGIGIGMFHCKLIVEAHRGRIEVESVQAKGTTFRVLLPLA